MALTAKHYKDAIFVQNASNLSGVVHSLSKVVSEIWQEANENGHGTNWVNNHPIVRLYVNQLEFLSGLNTETFMNAMDEAEEIVNSEEILGG